jgi:two-component system KDP operon response regulator KdpE
MIELLTLGADDYVVKPFNFDLLLARMGAHLRKSAVRDAGEPELTNGELRMDLVRHEVFLRGEKVSFTPKEYALLRYFMVNRGKMLTHKDILREVWGKAHAEDTQYLRTFIGQIRDKIEKDPANPSIILTEPGIGYRMETAA